MLDWFLGIWCEVVGATRPVGNRPANLTAVSGCRDVATTGRNVGVLLTCHGAWADRMDQLASVIVAPLVHSPRRGRGSVSEGERQVDDACAGDREAHDQAQGAQPEAG